MNKILKNANTLKESSDLDERSLGLMDEIYQFIRDVHPLLSKVNMSITENLHRMPDASIQLSKVTQVNEEATNEIMDTIDQLNNKLDLLNKNAKILRGIYDFQTQKPFKLLDFLIRAIKEKKDITSSLPKIDKAIQQMKTAMLKEYDFHFTMGQKQLSLLANDANAIMMSLQVQDITAQQIASVNNIITIIQKKLTEILSHFKNTGIILDLIEEIEDSSSPLSNISKLHREIAFDSQAIDSIANQDSRQSMVDDMFNADMLARETEDNNRPTSQDEIDKLFELTFN